MALSRAPVAGCNIAQLIPAKHTVVVDGETGCNDWQVNNSKGKD